MEQPTILNVRVHAKVAADDIADQLSHEQIINLFIEILDYVACVEVDEELIIKLWRGIQGCYGDDERPTLEDLLKQYPESKA